ncbi:hypothetical protein MICRO8M_50118 [Microbacterium sp. 8M]|nr:hypothetical protein MICRO8M_50118 [Microbacterium sp. 8M]
MTSSAIAWADRAGSEYRFSMRDNALSSEDEAWTFSAALDVIAASTRATRADSRCARAR